MFDVLESMPVETHHLRSSSIGRIVMFYTKCPRIIPEVKDAASRLVDKWIRPILRRSANYKDTSQVEVQMTSSRYARKDGARPVLYVFYCLV